MEQAGSDVHFDNYLTLLKDYCPAVAGLAAFDQGLGFVWQDAAGRLDERRLQPLVQELMDGDRDDQVIELDSGGSIELVKLKNRHGETLLALCLCLDATADAAAAPISRKNTFILLSELLLADYQQCLALASKEDELNFMTDELTRRYEELNLIYKAEDQALNIYHGRELLRQLVMNTSRFLNVDVIYISAQKISPCISSAATIRCSMPMNCSVFCASRYSRCSMRIKPRSSSTISRKRNSWASVVNYPSKL